MLGKSSTFNLLSRLFSYQLNSSFNNILIIRPSALGDVARTVPALVSLRKAYPDARIDWVVEQGMEAVIEAHPDLSNIVIFPKQAVKKAAKRLNPGPLLTFRRTLRAASYDAVFDLQGLARSAMMTYATGARVRAGLARARELGWLAYTHTTDAEVTMHTVQRMLEVIKAAGVPIVEDMRLYTSPRAQNWLSQQSWADTDYVVLAPTSRWPAKQWPQQRFAEVAKILADMGLTVLVVGGKSERDQCPDLLEATTLHDNIIDLVGNTSIAQLMAVLSCAALVVANDSAALHIAVGFDRPIVALFGPTRVERVGPYKREVDVVQHVGPADDLRHKVLANVRLMERISTTEVVTCCIDRLKTTIK